MSIRFKILIWFLALGIIPTLLVSVLFYENSKKIIEQLSISNLVLIADIKKSEIEDWIGERLKDLQVMTDNEDLEIYLTNHYTGMVGNSSHVLTTLNNLKNIFNYDKVYLADFSGRILVSTDTQDEGQNIDQKFIDQAILQKNIYIQDVYVSEGGVKKMSFVGPIYSAHQTVGSSRSAEVVGALVFEIEMEKSVFPIINKLSGMKKTGEMVLARKKDTFIEYLNNLKHSEYFLHNLSESNLFLGKSAVPMFFALDGNEGVVRAPDYRNIEVLAAYRYIPIMDWGFVVKEDVDDAFGAISDLQKRTTLIALSVVLFLVLLAFLVAQQIAKRLQLLRTGVEIVQKGNLDYDVKIKSKDEIGQISLAFDKLLQFIKNSRLEIENKVLIQTKRLQEQGRKLSLRQKAILNVLSDIEVEKKMAFLERDRVNIILQSIGDGVFVLDKNYRIIVFNDSASLISGFSEEEVIGKVYTEVLKFTFQVNKEINDKFVVNAIEKGEISRMTNHTLLTKKDGTQIIVADSAAPIRDIHGNILGCVVVFRDATKEAEVDKMKTEFVSLASHQLNTPLTGIKWFLELLLKGKAGKLNKEQTEFLQNIEFSNNRMIGLVNDLLNVSRIESGSKFVIEKKSKDVIKVLVGSIDRNAQMAVKRQVKVVITETVPKKLLINIDESKIDQIFGNLISNAIKYSNPKTEIKIDLEDKEQEVIFSFKNQGIGIPKDQQKRIFEKFFRADNIMTTDTEGNGLGLYIVKSIVEAHGGKVWFKSIEDKTTTFYVSLPK